MKHSNHPSSESLPIALIIFFIAGYQNAYTYVVRGNVFANLQTGNMILVSFHIAHGDFTIVGRYLIPLIFFCIGCAIASYIRLKNVNLARKYWHWQCNALLIQLIIFTLVGFIDQQYNIVANALITMNAAFILVTFDKFKGITLPSTMMIGNLKNSVQDIVAYALDHDKTHIHHFCVVFGLLNTFILGCLVESYIAQICHDASIWGALPLTLLAILIIEKYK